MGVGALFCVEAAGLGPHPHTGTPGLFSVASGDRQVQFGSRGYCGRYDARANSLRAGLQPFAWRSGIGVTRSAPAEERAHIVLRALSQNSTSVLESMNAASTTHLLL